MLIFDFDGTIADTYSLVIEISNILSDEFKYKKIKPKEVQALKNKSTQQIIRHLKVPIFKIPSILAKAKKTFYENIDHVRPFEDMKEVLSTLHAQGIKMAVLSSNSLQNIKHFLLVHELNFFEIVHTTPKIWSKNTSLKKLIESHNLSYKNIIYVGDEIRDIEAAQKMGIKIAVVTWGYNTVDVLKKYKPDYILNEPADLLKLPKSN